MHYNERFSIEWTWHSHVDNVFNVLSSGQPPVPHPERLPPWLGLSSQSINSCNKLALSLNVFEDWKIQIDREWRNTSCFAVWDSAVSRLSTLFFSCSFVSVRHKQKYENLVDCLRSLFWKETPRVFNCWGNSFTYGLWYGGKESEARTL